MTRPRTRPRRARRLSLLTAAAVAGALVSAAGTPAGAATGAAVPIDPMRAAIQRDLGLTAEQVSTLLASEEVATQADDTLRIRFGTGAFGGTWIDESTNRAVVGITDPALAEQVRAGGADPVVVRYSETELDLVVAELNEAAEEPPASVSGWLVDVVANKVVIQTQPGTAAAALAYATRNQTSNPDVLAVEETDDDAQPLADQLGGLPYFIGNSRCSLGFSVTGGFVTAGHCGATGVTVTGPVAGDTGRVAGASFPGNDYGWVQTSVSWRPNPAVSLHNGGGTIPVAGARRASRGSSVCRSGSTSGFTCGRIKGRNKTVRYPQGKVRGLTKTTIGSAPGDSGGSMISRDQAQGMTSGGNSRTTYFQPIGEVLNTYGLTLTVPRPCRGMTWSVSSKEWGRDIALVGADAHTNAYTGDTPCDRSVPVACLQPAGLPLPSGINPTYYSGWTGGNLRLTAPVRGSTLTSRAAADALCAAVFGIGWRMGEFHDGGGGWGWYAQGDPQRMWVAINDQPANPWNTATGRAMTWTVTTHQYGADVVDVNSDIKTNAYSGDTPTTTSLPVLCLRRDGRAVPPGITPTANNGWAQGEVRLTPPVPGTLLTSRLRADLYCLTQFGFGWRMAEFHDGGGGWGYWAAGDIGRMWVAINDQPANPWS